MNMLQRANIINDRTNSIVAILFTKSVSAVPIIVIRLIICNDVIKTAILLILMCFVLF